MQKQLKFSTRFRSTIYQVMLERGWTEAADDQEFDIAWLNKEEIAATYEQQRTTGRKFLINHYQSHQLLSRKDMLAQNVQKYIRELQKKQNSQFQQFKTIPLTFILPENYAAFVRYASERPGSVPIQQSNSTENLKKQRTMNSEKRPPSVRGITKISKISPKQLQQIPKPAKQQTNDETCQISQKQEITALPGEKFIVKPACLLQGQGIFIATLPEIQQWFFSTYKQIVKDAVEFDQKTVNIIYQQFTKRGIQISREQVERNYKSGHDLYLIQKYIDNPLLINNHKFDCRIYVLVKSFNPLNVYICNEGFARFALKSYFSNDLSAHLTNVAIQKMADDYDNQNDGAKMGLFELFQTIQQKYGRKQKLQCQKNVEKCIIRTLMTVYKEMGYCKHSFEIYGFDVMILDDLQVQICEVNACPSLSADTAEDQVVKKRMLHDALTLVVDQYNCSNLGCFYQIYSGQIDENDFDIGQVVQNIIIGDKTDRVVYV